MSDQINAPEGALPEVTVESLLAKVAETDPATAALIKELLDKGQIQIIALTDEATTAKALADEYAVYKQDALKLSTELEEAKNVITGQKETLTSLQARVNELETKPSSHPIIEVNKKKYEVHAKSFKYKGATYTVADLISNKGLQKELIGIQAGFLIEKQD